MPLLYFQNHLKKKKHQIFKKDTFLVASLRITLKKKKKMLIKNSILHTILFSFFSFFLLLLLLLWWDLTLHSLQIDETPKKNLSNLLIYFVFINYQVTHLTLFGKNSRSIYVWEFYRKWNIRKKFHLGVILFCCNH